MQLTYKSSFIHNQLVSYVCVLCTSPILKYNGKGHENIYADLIVEIFSQIDYQNHLSGHFYMLLQYCYTVTKCFQLEQRALTQSACKQIYLIIRKFMQQLFLLVFHKQNIANNIISIAERSIKSQILYISNSVFQLQQLLYPLFSYYIALYRLEVVFSMLQ